MLRDASCNWVDLLQVSAGEFSSVQFMCCEQAFRKAVLCFNKKLSYTYVNANKSRVGVGVIDTFSTLHQVRRDVVRQVSKLVYFTTPSDSFHTLGAQPSNVHIVFELKKGVKVGSFNSTVQYNTIQYKICKAPCCRGFRGEQ